MKRQAAILLVGLLVAAPARAADLPADDTYLSICRAVLAEAGEGRGSTRINDDGTLTVSIWRTKLEGGESFEYGSFCDFSVEPRRFTQIYITTCYECSIMLTDEGIADLNQQYFGD